MKEFILSVIRSRPGVTEDQIVAEVRQCLRNLLNEGAISISVSSKGLFPTEGK